MSDHTQACNNTDPKPTRASLAWTYIKWELYLLSLRLFYRRFSRTIHYFGMHRMKRMQIDRDVFYRCDWCGMHGTKVESTGKGISGAVSSPLTPESGNG